MRMSQRRFEAAEASEVDLNLLAVEASGFEQEKQLLELERQAEAIRLNQLLQRGVDVPVVLAGSLEDALIDEGGVEQIADGAAERRPDLVAMRHLIERARAEAKLAHAEAWEDWSFGIGVDADKQVFANEPSIDPIGTKRDEFLTFGLSIPLPLWNRNQGRVAEAVAEERRAVARIAALESSVEAEIATARARVVQLAKLERRQRESALAPISTLVQAQQQLANTALRRVRLLAELRQAEIDLETAAAASPLLRGAHTEEAKP
jgi:cobalt-zinc-cadmium efflux system outer membrane protein